jgi:hypothetical protein
MEYFLTAIGVIEHDLAITEYVMPCYNTLDDPEFAEDRGDLLAQRSALELVRDQLSDAQCLDLEEIDAHWRENSADFNAAFARQHADTNKETALRGLVSDPTGHAPAIPDGHWWWHPITPKAPADGRAEVAA